MVFRLLADAQFFQSRIGKIDGAGDLGQQLLNIINAKPVLASNKAAKPEAAKPEAAQNHESSEPPITQPSVDDTTTDVKEEVNKTGHGQGTESKPSASDEKTS